MSESDHEVMSTDHNTSPLACALAFTGRLASMKRDEAFALIRAQGGTPLRGITRKTNILVVGELGWPLLADGKPSKSLGLAKSYGVTIASERLFLEWAGKTPRDDQVRTYSIEQISALSGMSPAAIEELTQFGLLDCRNERYGFRDLAAARQLVGLLRSGVALSTITKSLREIRKWLPDAALSNLRLAPASADTLLVEQMKGWTDKTGQFVLPVESAQENADALFEQAQAAEEAGEGAEAQRLYRKVMRLDPDDPTASFNLGNLLRSAGRNAEAELAYRAATKADPGFAEAWYNLADLFEEQSQDEEAVACLKRALTADPTYADALFNLGLLHQRRNNHDEAVLCWRRYLALDRDSPWATRAQRALKYCEMQLAQSS
jgi:tetratricopeptide (TPR) repeat protein